VKTKKYFTVAFLNRKLQQFSFAGTDANDKPPLLPENLNKLVGHAAQNWCLLRFLPLLIGRWIDDKDDPVWELLLILHDIVSITCAPVLELGQTAFCKLLIAEYVDMRRNLFKDCPLRPKHHYLMHYPALMLKFGPLVHMWTLRFESKHSYFKRVIRSSQNFINICYSLTNRHQLLQAHQYSGSLFGCELELVNSILFDPSMYSNKVVDIIISKNTDGSCVYVAREVIWKGTIYKKGLYIVCSVEGINVEFGLILLAVSICDAGYLLVHMHRSTWIHDLHAYRLHDTDSDNIKLLTLSSLLNYYPLNAYRVDGADIIVLKHSVVSTDKDE
jgi:hypothetical protein